VNLDTVYADLNARLNATFSHGTQDAYLKPVPDLPYIVLNKQAFVKVGVDEKAAEEAVAAMLPDVVSATAPKSVAEYPVQHRLRPDPKLRAVYTRLQLAEGKVPPTEMGHMLAHSYSEHGNWYVMAILDAYQIQGTDYNGTTHYSPWSYDRHVPLAFYGTPFLPGEYHERVAPVDLAVTFASLAGVNQPSAAVGRVLTEAIKPAARPGLR